ETDVNNDGLLTIDAPGGVTLDGRVLDNSGVVAWQSGQIQMIHQALIDNAFGTGGKGEFDALSDDTISGDASAIFLNLGLFEKIGGTAVTNVAVTFNQGTNLPASMTQVTSGTLHLTGNGAGQDVFKAVGDGVLEFTADYTLDNAKIEGDGAIKVTGGNLNIQDTVTVLADHMELDAGGTITGTGALRIGNNLGLPRSSQLTWKGGIMTRPGLTGETDVNNDGLLTIDAPGGVTLDGRVLDNSGVVAWQSGQI